MSNEEEKPEFPKIIHEEHIVIEVPPDTSQVEIEKEIHKALSHEPQDFLRKSKSRQLIIVVKQEGTKPS
jgi:hypothetical protein